MVAVIVIAENSTLTLAVPTKLREEMRELRWVNWSEETRNFLQERVKRLKLLSKLDALTKESTLTEQDVLEIGRKVNQGIARRHGIKL